MIHSKCQARDACNSCTLFKIRQPNDSNAVGSQKVRSEPFSACVIANLDGIAQETGRIMSGKPSVASYMLVGTVFTESIALLLLIASVGGIGVAWPLLASPDKNVVIDSAEVYSIMWNALAVYISIRALLSGIATAAYGSVALRLDGEDPDACRMLRPHCLQKCMDYDAQYSHLHANPCQENNISHFHAIPSADAQISWWSGC